MDKSFVPRGFSDASLSIHMLKISVSTGNSSVQEWLHTCEIKKNVKKLVGLIIKTSKPIPWRQVRGRYSS
jgi:hypothetical protein